MEESDDSDEYAEAVPDPKMLALSFSDTETVQAALELDSSQGPVVGGPAAFKAHAGKVMEGINALIAETHEEVDNLFAEAEPVETTQGAWTCKVWETGGEKNHWRLRSCLMDAKLGKFAFRLEGRPLAATAEADYKVVLAGEGKLVPRFGGDKRGIGRIGYNLDNLASLTGRPVAGRLGIAYRTIGKARHLVLGLEHVSVQAMDREMHGVYRFLRVKGQGGRFSFVGEGDYLATGDQGELGIGQDTLVELTRAVIGWKATGEARTVLAACGGTVGDGECARLVQCWTRDDSISFQAVDDDGKGKPAWDKTACAELPLPVGGPPAESDMGPPTDADDEADAPILPEPEAIPGE
jgi:hypothetical protein